MKICQTILLAFVSILSFNVHSAPSLTSVALNELVKRVTESKTHFSPYADVTLNAHWDNQTQSMQPMDLNAVAQQTHLKSIRLAFITDSGNCVPAWGGQSSYPLNWVKPLTDRFNASKVDYIISMGGANGADLSHTCSSEQLQSVYQSLVTLYQPNGIDFDIENGTADIPKTMQAIKAFQRKHPHTKISFTLPVLPEGLTQVGENIVRAANSSGITFNVNIMAMDYGPAYVNDMGQYAIDAANHLFFFMKSLYPAKSDAQLWQHIEVTPMIGINDVNVEQFTLRNVETLVNFAKRNHMGALSMWSVARDNPCADLWASPICSGGNLQSRPYQYMETFLNLIQSD